MSAKIEKARRIIVAHKNRVETYMMKLAASIIRRAVEHDSSKLEEEELSQYATVIDEFDHHRFGSKGYKNATAKIAPAIQAHKSKHRHHPEHFDGGIDDMNLVDIMEMLCDWKAATLNNPDKPGDLDFSMKSGMERYNISPQLLRVMYNTLKDYDLL